MSDHDEEVLALCAQHPQLSLLGENTLERVVAGSRAVRYRAGRTFHKEGDPPDHAHFLLSGAVKIYVRVAGRGELLLELFRAPAFFAEMEVIAQRPFVAFATTLEPSLILHMPSALFLQLLERAPRLTHAVVVDLSSRLWVSTKSLIATAFEDVDTRVAGLLAMYADCLGVADQGVVRLTVPLTQEAMARDLGVSRKAVVKALRTLKKHGLLKKESARYAITDLDELKARGGTFVT